MKNTTKRTSAFSALSALGAKAPMTLVQAELLENGELYIVLEKLGLRYDSKQKSWNMAQLAPSGGRMSANSMFETDDGLGSGIVRLRLMAHPNDLNALINAIKQNPRLQVIEISEPYANRKGAGIRVYVTAHLNT